LDKEGIFNHKRVLFIFSKLSTYFTLKGELAMPEATVAIREVGEDVNMLDQSFKKANWRTRYLRSLSENGHFEISSREDLPNLITGTKVKIPTAFLERLEGQPRIFFNEKDLRELADSIKAGGAVENPVNIVIRKKSEGKHYGLIFGGERRWRASKIAKASHVICMIHDLADSELFARSATDNIGKVPLSPIEEALTIIRLKEEYGWTEEYIATRLAMSLQTVRQTQRYMKLTKDFQKKLVNLELTKGEALILAKWETKDQKTIFDIIERMKREGGGKSIHTNDLDLLVRREAEKNGLKKTPPGKKSKGKRPEASVDLTIKKVMRGAETFISTLKLTDGLKKDEVLGAKTYILDFIGSLEDAKKKLDTVLEKLNNWA
jgi:ParB/RepB/Spo0J family partition protein